MDRSVFGADREPDRKPSLRYHVWPSRAGLRRGSNAIDRLSIGSHDLLHIRRGDRGRLRKWRRRFHSNPVADGTESDLHRAHIDLYGSSNGVRKRLSSSFAPPSRTAFSVLLDEASHVSTAKVAHIGTRRSLNGFPALRSSLWLHCRRDRDRSRVVRSTLHVRVLARHRAGPRFWSPLAEPPLSSGVSKSTPPRGSVAYYGGAFQCLDICHSSSFQRHA